MLTLIWGIVFLAAAVLVIAHHTYLEHTFEKWNATETAYQASQRPLRLLMSIGLLFLSVIATWDSWLHPLFMYLLVALPDPETTVHTLTALALTVAAAVAYAVFVPVITVLTVSKWLRYRKGVVVQPSSARITYLPSTRKKR